MIQVDWTTFLAQWSTEMIECSDVRKQLPKKMIESRWLGFTGATEDQIVQAEIRLGVSLPSSYRSFLMVTNGWREAGFQIHKIWSVDAIDWYTKRHQAWVDTALESERMQALLSGFDATVLSVPDERYFVYGSEQETINIRSEYLKTALEISEADPGGDGVCLLNPQVRTPDGEWEAWFFAHWLPGARRYQSFWELMNGEHEIFLEIREEEYVKRGKYYQPR